MTSKTLIRLTEADFTAVRAIHEDYADDRDLLTGEDCELAAWDVREINEALADFLHDRAEEMDQPVRLQDVLDEIRHWGTR